VVSLGHLPRHLEITVSLIPLRIAETSQTITEFSGLDRELEVSKDHWSVRGAWTRVTSDQWSVWVTHHVVERTVIIVGPPLRCYECLLRTAARPVVSLTGH